MLKKNIFILLIHVFLLNQGISQEKDSVRLGAELHLIEPKKSNEIYFILKESTHFGQVINNYIYMDSFPERSLAMVEEIYFGTQTKGQKEWHQSYGYPQVGVSFFYGTMGNRQELGMVLGFIPTITFNSLNTNKWNVKINVGLGFSYYQTPYDSISNPYNILIGSHITNLSIASLFVHRQINEKLTAEIGLSVMHSSNGHYQVPNAGLNLPSLKIGLQYQFRASPVLLEKKVTENTWDTKLNLRVGVGIHEFAGTTDPVGTPKYLVHTYSVYLSKVLSFKSNFHTGFILRNYESYRHYIEENNLYDTDLALKSSVVSYFIGHEFIFGRLALLTYGGLDIYNPFYKKYADIKERSYNFSRFVQTYTSSRIGLNYYWKPIGSDTKFNAFSGIFVHANFGQADFVELSTGVVF